jgi:hypothetical protein
MALNLKLACHAGEGITVEPADSEPSVDLRIHGEIDGDNGLWRTLTPAEARELAAILQHHALEVEFR